MLRSLATFAFCAIAWILFVGGVKPEEMIVGGICIVLTVWFVYYLAKHDSPPIRLRFIDWVQIWRVPTHLVLDSGVILWVLTKDILHIAPAPSLYRATAFECDPDDPVAVARRILAIAYTTVTPNMIVIGIDVPTNEMLFHQLQRSNVSMMTRNLGAQA
jgi:multisubunit Na+/H+ antiporter MnhE subunit